MITTPFSYQYIITHPRRFVNCFFVHRPIFMILNTSHPRNLYNCAKWQILTTVFPYVIMKKSATARLPVKKFLQKVKKGQPRACRSQIFYKKQKNQRRARGSRVTGDGALLRRGIPEHNKKPIMRCNKGLSPVTRNTHNPL